MREGEHEPPNIGKVREELAVVQEVLKRFDRSLFGNGQPGMLDQLREEDAKIRTRLSTLERWIAIASGALLMMQFLTGSGVVSLKAFIGK